MKNSFRKAVSLIMAVLLVFTTVSLAAAKEDVTPVVVVSGMNSFPLTDKDGNTVQIFKDGNFAI